MLFLSVCTKCNQVTFTLSILVQIGLKPGCNQIKRWLNKFNILQPIIFTLTRKSSTNLNERKKMRSNRLYVKCSL